MQASDSFSRTFWLKRIMTPFSDHLLQINDSIIFPCGLFGIMINQKFYVKRALTPPCLGTLGSSYENDAIL